MADYIKVITARITPYRLPFSQVFNTATLRLEQREGLILELTSSDGHCGYGECAPLLGYSNETLSQASAELYRLCRSLGQRNLELHLPVSENLEQWLEVLPPSPSSAANFALESALFDLVAHSHRLPIYRALHSSANKTISLNALVGANANPYATIEGFIAEGYQVIKVKVSPGNAEQYLPQLLTRFSGQCKFRFDFNASLNLNAAVRLARCLEDHTDAIDYLEQPLAKENIAGYLYLLNVYSMPIAIDEFTELPLKLIDSGKLASLVLKPMFHGGALNVLRIAQEHQLDIVVTSLLEGGIGRLSTAHLAASLQKDRAHGLATGNLLTHDIIRPTETIANGMWHLPTSPGLGAVSKQGLGHGQLFYL